MKNKKFWIWKNQIENENKVRVLSINGTIAEDSWFDDDVTPKLFKEELFSDDGDVVIWLNSPGGDCIAASQIYSMLMDYPFNITVKIDGIAASAASVIAMAGTKVLLAPTALMMIHNPMTVAFGNHEDMKKAIDMLNQVKESIINAYELKTNQPRSKLSKLMDSETWMNANKAIELGFADGLLEDSKKTNIEDSYSFSGKNIESKLINKITNKYKKTSQEKIETGTSLNELEKRLFLIKP
ncbi:MAG: Clp protease ClpP [Fusobacterium sp. JB020]|nr:Clp protease ClpP [Fusobacterium sp. JB020]